VSADDRDQMDKGVGGRKRRCDAAANIAADRPGGERGDGDQGTHGRYLRNAVERAGPDAPGTWRTRRAATSIVSP